MKGHPYPWMRTKMQVSDKDTKIFYAAPRTVNRNTVPQGARGEAQNSRADRVRMAGYLEIPLPEDRRAQ